MASRVDPLKKTTNYNPSESSNTQMRSGQKKNTMKGRTVRHLKKYSGIPAKNPDPFDSDPPESAIIKPERLAAARLLRRKDSSSTLPPPLQNRTLKKEVPEKADSKITRSNSLPLGRIAFSRDNADAIASPEADLDSSSPRSSDSSSTLPAKTNSTPSTPLKLPASPIQEKKRPISAKGASTPPKSAIITPASVAAQRLLRRAAISSTLPSKSVISNDDQLQFNRSASLPLGRTAFSKADTTASSEADLDNSSPQSSDSSSTLFARTNPPPVKPSASTKRDDSNALPPDSTPPESAIITHASVPAQRVLQRKATSSTLPSKSGGSKDDQLQFYRSTSLPSGRTAFSSDKTDATASLQADLDSSGHRSSDSSSTPPARTNLTASTPLNRPAPGTPDPISTRRDQPITEYKGQSPGSTASPSFSDSSSSRFASTPTLTSLLPSSSSLTSATSDRSENPGTDVDSFNEAVLKLLAEHTERAERLIRDSSSSAAALTLPAPSTSTTAQVKSIALTAQRNRSMNVDDLNRLFAASQPSDKTLVAPSANRRAQTSIPYNQNQIILSHEDIAAFEFPVDPPIEELNLSWTYISDLQLGALARQLKDSLATLELSICEGLTDAGIEALGCLNRLRKFSLSSCAGVTTTGLCSFLRASLKLTSLTVVNVQYTLELHEAVARLQEIEYLEFTYCDGISEEYFLDFGIHLSCLKTIIISGIRAETVSKFQQKFPKIELTHTLEESMVQMGPEPVLELSLPPLQPPSGASKQPTSISVKPPYQFLIDFLALGHPDVEVETVLGDPEAWEDAVNAFYRGQLKKRHLDCNIPITSMNWLTLDRALQNYRPVDYIFMSHFAALKYEMPPSEVLAKPAIYEQAVARFYEEQLTLRRIEYDFSITPETWLDVEELLQAHHDQTVLNVFVRIFQSLGYFEEQLGEQIPQNLEELYRILLANIRMLESLRSLDFRDRQLIDLSNRIFCTKFKFLEEMNLSRNQIHQIPDFFLAGSESLEALLLGHNQLSFIPDNFGEGFRSITVLDFQHNQITEFPRLPFAAFQRLTLLNLEYNRIAAIPNNILALLKKLPKTTMVDLTGNPIPPDLFKEYQKQCPQLMVRISLPARTSESKNK